MKSKHLLVALAVVTGFTGTAHAIDFKNRLAVGGSYGYSDPIWRKDFDKTHELGQMYSGYLSYGLGNNISLVANYANLETDVRGTDQRLTFRPATLSLRFNMAPKWILNPYVRLGGGVSRNKREVPGSPDLEWTKMVGQGGAGLEVFVTQSTSFGAEATYNQVVAENGLRDYGVATYAGTINVYFGESEKTRRAKKEAADAKAEAERLAREKAAAEQQALAAQQAANQANQQAQQQLSAAQQATADAERRNQELQAQAKSAQAEIENIKQMVASKKVKPINFETGKAVLTADSADTLRLVADSVRKYPQLKVRVEGHTDSVGSDELNLTLSQKRAEAVRTYLTEKEGLPMDQISAVGIGERQPIDSNDTSAGRAKNRRVEFIYTLQ